MNITYTQNGDYLIPNIVIRKTKPIGHYRYGYILILYDGISPCRLIQKHFVVFLAVLIQTVISHWD